MTSLPPEVYHAVIAACIAAILVLAGLWVRSHDTHRAWTIDKVNAHEKTLGVLEHDFIGIREDLGEIKGELRERKARDELIHDAMIRKFDLRIGMKE